MTEEGRAGRISPAIRVALQLFLGLGAIAAVGGLVSFRRYVETSPRFCQTCHVIAAEVAIWTESEHRNVRCQQCHHERLEDGLRILLAYVSGETPVTEHGKVNVASCSGCHATHDERWPNIARSIGHRVHGRADLVCTACHGQQMHFYRPARATCLKCHADKSAGSAHEEAHCLACHNFLSTEEVILPSRRDCLRCHEALEQPIVVAPTAPMQFACYACHRPHVGDGVIACDECHKSAELAGLHRIAGHAKCAACHRQHDWVATRRDCDACHHNLASHHPEQRCWSCHSFEAGLGTGP